MQAPCSVFGLGLQVNMPLAGLEGLRPAPRADVTITLGPLPPDLANAAPGHEIYAAESDLEDSPPAVRVSRHGSHFQFAYADGTRILVDGDGENVWASAPPDATVEDTATYLLGPTMGFVLRLRGVTCLHASAVLSSHGAIAFAGPAGAGKSSTAAALARRGLAVLTDDVAPIRPAAHGFAIEPAYPRLRLWPDSSESLFGSADALPRLTPTWEKRYLDLNRAPYRFMPDPAPLRAIYLLDTAPGEAPSIRPLAGRSALMALVAETYSTRLLDRAQRADEFQLLSRLVESVPVRALRRGTFAHVDRLCDLVLEDIGKTG